ncbi:MAG: aldehyde dehydrogenase family protein [bacterium]|nr:aldehyde dehydrogenase family protein [bacterium]
MPEYLTVHSPWDGSIVERVPIADAAAMDAAIAAAVRAQPIVAALARHERQAVLRRIAASLARERERLAELMVRESGKPRRFARVEVDRAISTFSLAADEVTRTGGEIVPLDVTAAGVGYTALVDRRPVGVIGAIAPFNFPLNLVAHKLAPAIAVGNAVVLKAPPQAPLCAFELGKIVHEAGWPADALTVLHAPVEVAQALATDERIAMLSFTGSSTVGWHLKSIAGRKRVALELGGNAAAIVCDDADLDWAAKRCALGSFAQSGQVCIKVQRIYVARSRYDAFLERLLAETAHLKAGDPSDDDTIVGPLIDTAAADRVERWIREALAGGATLLAGGTRARDVIAPTLLADTTPDMLVECEEIFGPVTTIVAVDDLDAGIARANASRYGLQAGVFTNDVRAIARAFEGLDVGGVVINDYPTLRIDNFPYGGIKESGFGREGVRYAMDEMSELKTLVVKYR